MALPRLFRRAPSALQLARAFDARARIAGEEQRYGDAVLLYRESLQLAPDRPAIYVQYGHMLKESGDFAGAEEQYRTADRLRPDDADLALQFGHLYRCMGRIVDAAAAYERAIAANPGWELPARELEELRAAGWSDPTSVTGGTWSRTAGTVRVFHDRHALAPELAPRDPSEMLHHHGPVLEIRQLGRRERTAWGIEQVLRGIESIRGWCIADAPILEVQLRLNGRMIYRGPAKGGYLLAYEAENRALHKYVFNIWLDFSAAERGRHAIEICAINSRGRTQRHGRDIVVADPLSLDDFGRSDGLIPPAPAGQSLEAWIGGLPSMMREGRRAMLARKPGTILVQRADQLGDMVVSRPAILRLREIFPDSRFVGLVTGSNVAFAESLGLFDVIEVVDFPEDYWERRRIMPLDKQEALRSRLAPYQFDLAIDLSENRWSRLLLPLSGAPYLFGFRSDAMPGLTIDLEGNTHDRIDYHEIVPHTNKQMGLVEWIGALLRSEPNIQKRDDLSRDRLAFAGLLPDDDYIVLHDGARLKFSRWPHYLALAQIILEKTDLRIVMISDDPDLGAQLPEPLCANSRFRLIDYKLGFDDFDALLSFCKVFVGNDSGPKHLASLRGTQVVSIHMARNNWNEWGQENGGFIMSRRVPCAGCLIHYDPEECGRDYACITQIEAAEVFHAVHRLL